MKAQISREINYLEKSGRFEETKNYIQHGSCSVYDHSVRVAEMSMKIEELLKIHLERRSLIRGALLHDYFLYDWHDPDPGHRLHGFTHPKTALCNAGQDYQLTEVERDIILHHMFPLVLNPPKHKEAWVVCVSDKICALCEIWDQVRNITKRKVCS